MKMEKYITRAAFTLLAVVFVVAVFVPACIKMFENPDVEISQKFSRAISSWCE